MAIKINIAAIIIPGIRFAAGASKKTDPGNAANIITQGEMPDMVKRSIILIFY